MIQPDLMIQQVVSRLVANKVALGITAADEISEDPSKHMRPPYCGVFAKMEEEAYGEASDNTLINIPIGISVWVFSSEKKSGADAVKEAWNISRKVVDAIRGVYTFNQADLETDPGAATVTVSLKLSKKPREIMSKSASQSVVAINFYYEDPAL